MGWVRKLNPARVYAVIAALFALLTAFGITVITEDMKVAVFGLVAALFSLVAGEATRGQVVPAAKVLAYVDHPEGHYPEIKSGEATVAKNHQNTQEILDAAYTGRHRAEP